MKVYRSNFLGGRTARIGQATRRVRKMGRKGGVGILEEGWEREVGAMGVEGGRVVLVPGGGSGGDLWEDMVILGYKIGLMDRDLKRRSSVADLGGMLKSI